MPFLKVSDITLQGSDNEVLHKINFSQKKFEKIAISGETGSGKSSLLKIIAGLMQPDEGEVLFENERVEGPSEKLVPGHSGIAYLSQHFELPKFLTVEQVLSYSNLISDEEANKLYEICQIDHLLERKTDQLSGGERQRISLARLLTSRPKLLLLDEPFSNLDMMHKSTLKTVIKDISDAIGITCILISHDPADVLAWANKILVMKGGRIIQKGTPAKIYKEPLNEYVAGLFGKYNLIPTSDFTGSQKKPIEESTEKRSIVRPEDFQMGSIGKNGSKAIVKEIRYFGSYYEVKVATLGQHILIRTENENLKLGETVSIHLAKTEMKSSDPSSGNNQ